MEARQSVLIRAQNPEMGQTIPDQIQLPKTFSYRTVGLPREGQAAMLWTG